MLRWWVAFMTLFAISLATSLATTPLARRIAIRVGAIDYPSARRVNKSPVPRMGGIAIYMAVMLSFVVGAVGSHFLGWRVFSTSAWNERLDYRLILLSFTAIFVTGLLDDKFSLSPAQKLVGQVVAACLAVWGGLIIDEIIDPVHYVRISLGWLAYPITVIYLVAYTNIFNLIDGLDGLASGIAGIASVTMWVVSVLASHMDAAAFAIILAGACLGFLRYNFHPAAVFLGDSGSLLIGFVLGSISLLSVSRVAGLTAIIVPLVIAGIPIIDTFSAIVRRGRAHVSIGHADKGHIHHRLLSEGFNQRQTVLVMYAWTAILCVSSVVMTQVAIGPRVLIFVVLIVASFLFAWHLHLFEPVLLHHYDQKTGEDELVCPEDPEFEEEAERFEDEHAERIDRLTGPAAPPADRHQR